MGGTAIQYDNGACHAKREGFVAETGSNGSTPDFGDFWWRRLPSRCRRLIVPIAVSLRRLTEQEYRNSIADIFGKEIEVRGSFEPTRNCAERS